MWRNRVVEQFVTWLRYRNDNHRVEDRAGFYGTYMLPDITTNADGSFAIDFTMSTWDPYNVALMSATFE